MDESEISVFKNKAKELSRNDYTDDDMQKVMDLAQRSGELSWREIGSSMWSGMKRWGRKNFCDSNGDFSLKETTKTVGKTAAYIAGGAAVIAGAATAAPAVGVASGTAAAVVGTGMAIAWVGSTVYGLGKDVVNYFKADTKEDAKAAITNAGEDTAQLGFDIAAFSAAAKASKPVGKLMSKMGLTDYLPEFLRPKATETTSAKAGEPSKAAETVDANTSPRQETPVNTEEAPVVKYKPSRETLCDGTIVETEYNQNSGYPSRKIWTYKDNVQVIEYYNAKARYVSKETVKYPDGKVVVTEHIPESGDRKVTTTYPDGRVLTSKYEYNNSGYIINEESVPYSDGSVRTRKYDAEGNIKLYEEITYPDGQVEIFVNNSDGRLIRRIKKDSSGNVIERVRMNNDGNLIERVKMNNDGSIARLEQYDSSGRRIKEQYGLKITEYEYFLHSTKKTTRYEDGRIIVQEYDSNGRVFRRYDRESDGRETTTKTTYLFDDVERVTRTYSDGTVFEYEFNRRLGKILRERKIDANNNVIEETKYE